MYVYSCIIQTIDADAEKITLGNVQSIDIVELSAQVPNDHPRFHFFRYDHEHEGEDLKSVVMIYSCPDGSGNTKSAPVRLRMLYSSSKANIENILTTIGGRVDAKLEVNQSSEVSPQAIHTQLHPPKEEKKEVHVVLFVAIYYCVKSSLFRYLQNPKVQREGPNV